MNIVVGINGMTEEKDIRPLVASGADEFYIGYVPQAWSDKFGWEICPNRRPYKDYSYRTFEEAKKVCDTVHALGKKIYLALNEHEYDSDRMAVALDILRDGGKIGFDAAIVSNLALMIEARSAGVDIPFTVSIGGGASSAEAIDFYLENVTGIGRIILPRSLTMKEIKKIADEVKGKVALEAFAIGDPCAFNDEYCFSWHSEGCEMFCAFLLSDPRFVRAPALEGNWKKRISLYDGSVSEERRIVDAAARNEAGAFGTVAEACDYEEKDDRSIFLSRVIRMCGLCSLKLFDEWGISAVKVPARGGEMRDEVIRMVKKAIDGGLDPAGCRALIGDPKFCSGRRCYYNYPS